MSWRSKDSMFLPLCLWLEPTPPSAHPSLLRFHFSTSPLPSHFLFPFSMVPFSFLMFEVSLCRLCFLVVSSSYQGPIKHLMVTIIPASYSTRNGKEKLVFMLLKIIS